jgi:hypothetical protein
MKRMSFYAKRNRSGNLLHIETDGCIVNIRVGLHDAAGRQVTSVMVDPDNYAEDGGKWVQDDSRVVQLRAGEQALIAEDGAPVTITLSAAEQELLISQEYQDSRAWANLSAKVKAVQGGRPDEWRDYRAEPEDECEYCHLPVDEQDNGFWEDPDYPVSSSEARYCDSAPDHLHHA